MADALYLNGLSAITWFSWNLTYTFNGDKVFDFNCIISASVHFRIVLTKPLCACSVAI